MSKNQFPLRTERKGQSAIEYLTTYGWAILAIVIAGAAILLLLNQGGATCPKTAPATAFGGNMQLDTWAFTGNSQLDLELRNSGGQTMTINDVYVDSNQDESFTEGNTSVGTSLNTGDTTSVTVSSISGLTSGACNQINVRVNYDISGLDNPTNATGTLQGTI